jgi:hypothetical protein
MVYSITYHTLNPTHIQEEIAQVEDLAHHAREY